MVAVSAVSTGFFVQVTGNPSSPQTQTNIDSITINAGDTGAFLLLSSGKSTSASTDIAVSNVTLCGQTATQWPGFRTLGFGGANTDGETDAWYVANPSTGVQHVTFTVSWTGGTGDWVATGAIVSVSGALDAAIVATAVNGKANGVASVTAAVPSMATGDLAIGIAGNGSTSPGVTTGTLDRSVTGVGATGSDNICVGHNSGTGTVNIVFSTNSADESQYGAGRIIASAGGSATANAVNALVTVTANNPVTTAASNFYSPAPWPLVGPGANPASPMAWQWIQLHGVDPAPPPIANAVAALVTVTASNPAAYGPNPVIASLHSSGRYPLDQFGHPYFIQGTSPQDIAALGTSTEWASFFATMQTQGVNSVQVHLMVSDAGSMGGNAGFLDHDGNAPFTSMSTFSGAVSAYWARIDTMFATAATYGVTVWASPCENVTCGSTIDGMTTGQCFAFGQFIGARYKNQPNIVWSFGNDYLTTDWAARDPKYLQVLAGIRDQGDTHLTTLWTDGNGHSPWDDANWDGAGGTGADLMLSYGGTSLPAAILTAYDDTSLTAPKPVFEGEAHYEGEPVGSPASLHELRGQAWWPVTCGACGHFYGQHAVWPWAGSQNTQVSDAFALQMQKVTLVPTLTNWHLLKPDESHVFLTGGRGTESGDPATSTLATASFINGGLTGLIYFPTSRGSITVDTTKLAGTVTAYWYDPTNGSTSTETSPATPTHPGNNAAGVGDWVLVLAGTSTSATANAVAATVTVTATDPAASGTATASAVNALVTVTATDPVASGQGNATASAVNALVTVTATDPVATGTATASAVNALVTVTATDPVASGTATASPVFALVTVTATNPVASAPGGSTANAVAALVTVSANNPSASGTGNAFSVAALVTASATNPVVQTISNAFPPAATVTVTATDPTFTLTARASPVFALVGVTATDPATGAVGPITPGVAIDGQVVTTAVLDGRIGTTSVRDGQVATTPIVDGRQR